jgi:hypothetical protein
VPYVSQWKSGQQVFNFGIDAPEISTRAIASLFIVAIVLSILLMFLPLLALCIGIGVKSVSKGARWRVNTPVLQAIIAFIAFVCVLAGVVVTKVQVSSTVSGLQAQKFGISQDSRHFWAIMWSAVGLYAWNLLLVLVLVLWYQRRKAVNTIV